MRGMVTLGLALAFTGINVMPGAGQEKEEPQKETPVLFKGEDFPIREGPEALRDKKEDVRRKEQACKTKYQGKLVKVVGMVYKKPGQKDTPQVYTLRITYAVRLGPSFASAFQDVDVIPAKAAPELHQPSRSGLIAAVVGRGRIDARGRLVVDEARVLGTSIPPG